MQLPDEISTELTTTSFAARELDTSEAYVRKLANQGKLGPVIRTLSGMRLLRRENVTKLAVERRSRRG